MLTPSSSQPHRILVAEDETLIRMDLVEMLGEAGYNVVAQASNGQEAIELVNEHKPDLAILDVKMPILDGISAAEQIISISPVLILTAFSQKDLVERARDAGAMAYVVKPFTINDLLPAIEISISRHKQMKSLEAEVADRSSKGDFDESPQPFGARSFLLDSTGGNGPPNHNERGRRGGHQPICNIG
jgi:AmiR/NasT family two-component response regulator